MLHVEYYGTANATATWSSTPKDWIKGNPTSTDFSNNAKNFSLPIDISSYDAGIKPIDIEVKINIEEKIVKTSTKLYKRGKILLMCCINYRNKIKYRFTPPKSYNYKFVACHAS